MIPDILIPALLIVSGVVVPVVVVALDKGKPGVGSTGRERNI